MFDFIELLYVFLTSIAIPFVIYAFAVPGGALFYIYWVLIAAFGMTSLWVFIESISSLFFKSSQVANIDNSKSILILIPAYMDNEQFVLQDTLDAFSKLSYTGSIRVVVTFNVRNKEKTIQFENYLYSTWDDKTINNITFEVIENKNSKSKAENVNYALSVFANTTFDYIGVFDADHQPSPDCINNALHTFNTTGCDIVQGQCAIRNITDCFLSRIITMEFCEMYNVGHQGRCNVFNLGIFGGSNGLWKADLLKRIKMDHSMLTEDIDSSFKSLVQGAKIAYARNMISYELSPIFWDVLVKQRKRWAQGWLEVSIKYFYKTMISKHFTFRQKVGCFLILCWRDIFVYLTFHPFMIIAADYYQFGHLFVPSYLQIAITCIMIVLGIAKSSIVFFVSNKHMKDTLPKYWFVIYVLFYPFYAVFSNIVHISTHIRHLTSRTEWVATTRETSPTTTAHASQASLQSLDAPTTPIEVVVQ
jgi:cellulose synthase/poly-beta-1,6-N-acetylglucosamine synthase-like glycosyltransferase